METHCSTWSSSYTQLNVNGGMTSFDSGVFLQPRNRYDWPSSARTNHAWDCERLRAVICWPLTECSAGLAVWSWVRLNYIHFVIRTQTETSKLNLVFVKYHFEFLHHRFIFSSYLHMQTLIGMPRFWLKTNADGICSDDGFTSHSEVIPSSRQSILCSSFSKLR